jgi:hypothetical protein
MLDQLQVKTNNPVLRGAIMTTAMTKRIKKGMHTTSPITAGDIRARFVTRLQATGIAKTAHARSVLYHPFGIYVSLSKIIKPCFIGWMQVTNA